MTNRSLLFIDDEIHTWYMQYYIEAFEENGFVITKCQTTDEARIHLEGEKKFDVICIDVVMPPGDWFKKEETHGGLLTGKFLAREAEKLQPQAVRFFLTNIGNPERIHLLKQIAPLIQKIDYAPDSLVKNVLELLERT